MESAPQIALLVLAFSASYIQSVAGFAMGMIIMAVAGGFGWVPIPLLAAVISLLSLVNVAIAVKHHWRRIHRPLYVALAAGQVPAIAFGLWLLHALSSSSITLLELLLGLFIAAGSASLAVRPRTFASASGPVTAVAVGLLGGVVGGLFSASGPVMGWFGYRQPLPFAVVRATLLACFATTTSVRTLFVGVRGELTLEVLTLCAWLLPLVALGSWLGDRFAPPVPETVLKRGAFVLLFALGLWITLHAAGALLPQNFMR